MITNKKIKIHSLEHFIDVQKRLFKFGNQWAYNNKKLLMFETVGIFISKGGKMSRTNLQRTYRRDEKEVITLDDLYKDEYIHPMTVVTLQDIADKFNCKVSQLKINDT